MQNSSLQNWDNVRIFLGTMRAGSLRQAAIAMGISHPTARRRLFQLEEELGFRLFERRVDGLHATPEAAELMELAEQVEASIHGFERTAQASDSGLHGPLRVSLPNLLASDLLMPDLVAFAQKWPDIRLALDDTYDLARLDRREADVAIRFMRAGQLPQGELVGRKVVQVFRALYGEGENWIGWGSPESDASWIATSARPDLGSIAEINDPLLQRSACLAGFGLTQLPCFIGEPLLQRRSDPEHAFDIWVLVHPDMKQNPKIRAFRDDMTAALIGHKARLAGIVD